MSGNLWGTDDFTHRGFRQFYREWQPRHESSPPVLALHGSLTQSGMWNAIAEGVASVPADPAAFRATLDLFLIEKALYELRYEIANRPDWMQIPLRGLLEITQ